MSKTSASTQATARGAFAARAAELGVGWQQPVVRGVAAIALGALAVLWPGLTIVVLTSLVGIFAIVDGVLSLFDGIRERRHYGAEFQVATGVISLIAGVVLLVWPAPTLFVLTLLAGMFTVGASFIGIFGAFRARGAGVSGWGWGLAAAIWMLAFGLLLLIAPVAGMVFVTVVFGVYAVMFGATLIGFGLALRKTLGDVEVAEDSPADDVIDIDSAQL